MLLRSITLRYWHCLLCPAAAATPPTLLTLLAMLLLAATTLLSFPVHVVLELTGSPVPAMGVATGTAITAFDNIATTTLNTVAGSSLILLLRVRLLPVWLLLGSARTLTSSVACSTSKACTITPRTPAWVPPLIGGAQ